MKNITRIFKILKRLHFDFSKLLTASSKSESSERDYLFSRNGNMNSACLTIFFFHFAGFFYFHCRILSLNTRFSKLLILLSHLFSLCSSVLKATFKFLAPSSHADNMTLSLWAVSLHIKMNGEQTLFISIPVQYHFHFNFILFVHTGHVNFNFNQCSTFTERCF